MPALQLPKRKGTGIDAQARAGWVAESSLSVDLNAGSVQPSLTLHLASLGRLLCWDGRW